MTDDTPVTLGLLRAVLREELAAQEQRTTEKMTALEQRTVERMSALQQRTVEGMTALEHRLVETMRDMQTEILRGFEAFTVGQTLRIRKIEADQSNLDASLSGRVEAVEKRLLQIEQRLGRTM